MQSKDVRWQQRFQNFEKALRYLQDALHIKQPDIIQKAGLIQFFEMSFELAWNMLKDYLEDQGYIDVTSPRAAIKKAFAVGLIADGHRWLELLENRNLTAHAYDEKKAAEIEQLIRGQYYPLLNALYGTMKQKKL